MTWLIPPVIVIIIGVAILASLPSSSKQQKPSPDSDEKPESKEAKILERFDLANKLLTKCNEHGIVSAETPDDQSNIWIVGQSIGVGSKEEALSLFSEATNPSPEVKTALQRRRESELAAAKKRDSDRIARNDELYPASLVGKDKYLTRIKKELPELKEQRETYFKASVHLANGDLFMSEKPKNVTFEAAKGQILGGPGLAAAKATAAENYNSTISGGKPEASEGMLKWADDLNKKAYDLTGKIMELEGRIADIESRLIDIDNPEKYTKYVKCKVKALYITEGGNIDALVFTIKGADKGATILDMPARVDGSIVIHAWSGNEQIGELTYSPRDGFDGDLNEAGFGFPGKDEVIIPANRELNTDDLDSITFSYEPKTVWAIQRDMAF